AGKILAALVALGGIGLVALPAGILAAGFEEALAEDREPRVCPRCGEAIP
ncbi:MAG: ion transporter, partial [Armatimonadetes bacterium]|nr:ion transporter [Armatimonadota bacterium]